MDSPRASQSNSTRSASTQPAIGVYGNTGRNILTQPGINNWDLGFIKNFPIWESVLFSLRVESFNTFNHPQYNVNVGGFTASGSGGGSNVDNGFGDPTVWTNHSGLPWTHHSIRREVNLLIKAIQIRHSIMEWRIFFDRDKLARMIKSRRGFPGALLVLCLSIPSAFAQSTNDELMQKYAEDGQKAMASGHYAEAEKSFVAMEKLQPSIAEIHATLGVIYFTEKKFDKAVAEIRQAEKLKPGLPNLNTLLALSLSELGQYEEALPNLETGFQQATEPSVKRMCGLQLMRAYSALQRDSQAVDVALKLDSAFPNDPEVLYQTSRVYGNSAFLNMQKLRREAPNSVWRHLAAAEAYESEGQYNNAIDEYRQVLVLEPRRLGVHYRIGRTMLARSRQANSPADIAEARKEFEAELALDPRNGNATIRTRRDAPECRRTGSSSKTL